jgi:hypothetical protein
LKYLVWGSIHDLILLGISPQRDELIRRVSGIVIVSLENVGESASRTITSSS